MSLSSSLSIIVTCFLVFFGCVEAGDINLGASDFKCPAGSSIYPSTDCNKYYTCYGGEPVYLWQCRDDLLFDLTYNGCNFKEQTNCGNRVTPAPGVSTTTVAPTFLPSTCSAVGDGFYPTSPSECKTQFITCLDGVAYSNFNCPANGVFDPVGRKCVSPLSPACKKVVSTSTTSTTRSPAGSSAGSTPSTTHSSPSSTTTKPTTKPPTGPAFKCPQMSGFFADPTECTKYYQCSGGFAFSFTCPNQLYFSVEKAQCDWPSDTICQIRA